MPACHKRSLLSKKQLGGREMDGEVFCEVLNALTANSSPLTHVLRSAAMLSATLKSFLEVIWLFCRDSFSVIYELVYM